MSFSPPKKRIGITLDTEILKKVDEEKDAVGRSRSNYINHILRCVLIGNTDNAGEEIRSTDEM